MAKRANPTPEFPTIREAAHRSGIGEKTLRRAVRSGALSLHQLEGTWPRLRWSDVRSWIEGARVPVTSHAEALVERVLARESRRAG